ncbi:MAG: translation initiation factor IF-2 subunit beta [Candidatus Verstraetearchaeota archaeon]|nr:translation initiation factor IF-2 subunit beta [Candidatus Verstraetearchaeota archaeon]
MAERKAMQYDYLQLLDRARSVIPEQAYTVSRFEIPKANVLIMGSRTIIQNFKEIAERLNRDPHHVLRYLLRELATAGSIEDVRAVLQGRFSKESVDNVIARYTRGFVICPACGKPDTKIVREGRLAFLVCEVCGAKNPVRSLA